MLWSVPGRRDTIKFFGATRDEAEQHAVAFIVEHCRSRGHRILNSDEPCHPVSAPVATSPEQPLIQREPRLPHAVPARFGANSVDHRARTADLSRGGLFLATGRPLPGRTDIRIVLDDSPYEIPLRGTVAWSRIEAAEGKPVGMGVQLAAPPAMYLRYVDRLLEPRGGGDGGVEPGEDENPG
jgi:Tfp pilus assembly protein PilZ